MKLKKVVTGVLLATGAAGAYAGQFKTAHVPSNAIEGQYIVVLKDNVVEENEGIFSSQANLKAVQMVNDQLSLKYQARVKRTYKTVLKGGVYEMSEAQAQKLAQDPSVELVEEDQMMSINATQNNATWGIDRVDQRNLPLSGTYTYNTTASNVNAYIIDTGIDMDHSEFGNRASSGIDTVDNDYNAEDCQGHGTHVAGTVGGSTYGIAKGANLIGVRVLGCNGSGSNSGVIAGMDWVADNHSKPAVANMSLGGGASSASDQAVARLTQAGVTTVVAAGNDNSNACNYSPARAPSAITVGSTTSNDSRSSFSNYGNCLDIYAPGSSIRAARLGGGSTTLSGTSMASPHVAGVAALYLAANPNASVNQVTNAITSAATPNKVSDAKSGSPNLLLYSLFDGSNPDPDPDPDPPGDGGEATLPNLSGNAGSWSHYYLDVPAGMSTLDVQISGGSGDADLYVRRGAQPTSSAYDCRPYRWGNNESCSISNPAQDRYYISLYGYQSFSGVTLNVVWE
jgi:serine protease